MKKCFLWLAMLALTIPAPAAAVQPSHCHADYISDIDGSGRLITLGSGQTYEVFPGQNQKSIFWLPSDKVTVCLLGAAAGRITNLSKHNTSVQALRQF